MWKKILVGTALLGTLAVGGIEATVPAHEGLDDYTKGKIEDSQQHRKWLSDRLVYMTDNQQRIGIPDASLAKAVYAKDEFENYLVRKQMVDVKGGDIKRDAPKGVVEPVLDALLSIEWIQKAYALTFDIEDFESCGAIPCSFTSDDSTGTGDMNLDAGSIVNGTDSLRCDIAAANDGCRLTKTLTSASTYYFQYYYFVPTGWTFGASGYAALWNVGDGAGNPVRCNIEDYGALRITCAGDELGYTDTSLNVALNTKTRLEFRIVISTTAGDLDIWLNNTTEGSPSYNGSGTLNTGAQNITQFTLGGYHPDIVNDKYYDDTCANTAFMGGTLCVAVAASTPIDTTEFSIIDES